MSDTTNLLTACELEREENARNPRTLFVVDRALHVGCGPGCRCAPATTPPAASPSDTSPRRAPIHWLGDATQDCDIWEITHRYARGQLAILGSPTTLYLTMGNGLTFVVPVDWWIYDGDDGKPVAASDPPRRAPFPSSPPTSPATFTGSTYAAAPGLSSPPTSRDPDRLPADIDKAIHALTDAHRAAAELGEHASIRQDRAAIVTCDEAYCTLVERIGSALALAREEGRREEREALADAIKKTSFAERFLVAQWIRALASAPSPRETSDTDTRKDRADG